MRPVVDAMCTVDSTSYILLLFEGHGQEHGPDTSDLAEAMITLSDLPVSCRALTFSQTLLFFIQLYQTSWHNKKGFKSKKLDCSVQRTLTLIPPHYPPTALCLIFSFCCTGQRAEVQAQIKTKKKQAHTHKTKTKPTTHPWAERS